MPTPASPAAQEALRPLVETAMFSALSGVLYTAFSTVGIDRYLGYLLPLPAVVASVRSGGWTGIHVVLCTAALLTVLQGPLRASVFVFMHGLVGATLGWVWALKLPWRAVVPLAAVAKVLGVLGYVSVSSWVLQDNLFNLVVTNVSLMLDHVGPLLGFTGSPGAAAIAVAFAAVMFIQAVWYIFMTQVLYTILIRILGYETLPLPRFVSRALNV